MDLKEAKEKAQKCLECENPSCVKGCPLNIRIPDLMRCIKEEKLEEAYHIILEKSYFGSVCGRVCSHDSQCRGACVQSEKGDPVDIGALEAFVSDWGLQNSNIGKKENNVLNKERIAVVGAGPAGLTAAIKLERKGYAVTLFEKTSEVGGILQYGIPEYRLPKDIMYDTVDAITMARMEIEVGKELGKDFEIDDLFRQGYKAVFLAIGCETPKRLVANGTDKRGVYHANEFLKRMEYIKFENVVVIGGGNVAMDVARMAKARGAKTVNVLYRRARAEMKANQKEIISAIESGINVVPNSVVTDIMGQESVTSVKCQNNTTYKCDTVVIAIGSLPNLRILGDLKLTEEDLVAVNENGETSRENVFAGGDLTCRNANVSEAIKSANIAVDGIEKKMIEYKRSL